jgi:putative phosphoribosyl transferase
MIFHDRAQAGRLLAERLRHLQGQDVVVLGLPRGGVPVAFEVARALGAPMDVIVVRKIGVPYQPELAMGAVGEGGVLVANDPVLRVAHISKEEFAAVAARERDEVERRANRFRGSRPRTEVSGRIAIVVDDGLATGSTAQAACRIARAHGAARVVLAVPVAPTETINRIKADADEVICLRTPRTFYAVGEWYRDFSQTTDDEVIALVAEATPDAGVPGSSPDPIPGVPGDEDIDEDVDVVAGPVSLPGRLTVPAGRTVVRGIVVFVHGSGSSRHSPRNRAVAAALNASGWATLLFDLLTPAEEVHRANVFDIELLAERLGAATHWVQQQPQCARLPVGYFGASTGAAAALWAAGESDSVVRAVVSRGGRPDLAGPRLTSVKAPTLLIVGGRDDVVLEKNRRAQAELRCENRLSIVPGATHLFEEPGALPTVAGLACDWFIEHLT